MSRVGQRPIVVPDKVNIRIQGSTVNVEGPKGKLAHTLPEGISAEMSEGTILVKRSGDEKLVKSLHGLSRTLVDNMVKGVTDGYSKELEIQGVGYRAVKAGQKLNLFVGYNTKVPEIYDIPKGVEVTLPTPTEINIVGIDKQLVGQVAASIRHIRPPDVYKGKGVRYKGEVVRKLPGKTVAAAGA
jgi:large subunit ribosomal protein L6